MRSGTAIKFQANFNGSSVYASAPSRPPAVFDSRLEPAVERIEILEAFADLPDVRKASGKRHHLALCLALFTLAITAGNRGFLAIGDWLNCYRSELIALFNPPKGRLPSYSTFAECSSSWIIRNIQRP